MDLINPFYDQSDVLGFSYIDALNAIKAGLQAAPEQRLWTPTQLGQLVITANVATAAQLAGKGWLLEKVAYDLGADVEP